MRGAECRGWETSRRDSCGMQTLLEEGEPVLGSTECCYWLDSKKDRRLQGGTLESLQERDDSVQLGNLGRV